jgi:membrane-associated phospholipid phosphatase
MKPQTSESVKERGSSGRGEVARHWARSWQRTLAFLRQYRWRLLGALVGALPLLIYTFSHDLQWSRAIRGAGEHQSWAREIGSWGSLAQYNFLIFLVTWLLGALRKSNYLKRLAMMTAVATILAGVFCNSFRFTLGRPRPFTGEPPMAFRGPQAKPRFHGFPSGHVSTAFGTAVPLLIALPDAGVPVTLFAGAMSWARMYDRQHYPSDVWMGAWIGTLFGIAGGVPLARVRKRLRRRRERRGH